MKLEPAKEGEWIQPIRRGYKLCCCDCGLVHKIDFRIYQRHIQFRAFLASRSTGQVRRHLRNGDKL